MSVVDVVFGVEKVVGRLSCVLVVLVVCSSCAGSSTNVERGGGGEASAQVVKERGRCVVSVHEVYDRIFERTSRLRRVELERGGVRRWEDVWEGREPVRCEEKERGGVRVQTCRDGGEERVVLSRVEWLDAFGEGAVPRIEGGEEPPRGWVGDWGDGYAVSEERDREGRLTGVVVECDPRKNGPVDGRVTGSTLSVHTRYDGEGRVVERRVVLNRAGVADVREEVVYTERGLVRERRFFRRGSGAHVFDAGHVVGCTAAIGYGRGVWAYPAALEDRTEREVAKVSYVYDGAGRVVERREERDSNRVIDARVTYVYGEGGVVVREVREGKYGGRVEVVRRLCTDVEERAFLAKSLR